MYGLKGSETVLKVGSDDGILFFAAILMSFLACPLSRLWIKIWLKIAYFDKNYKKAEKNRNYVLMIVLCSELKF